MCSPCNRTESKVNLEVDTKDTKCCRKCGSDPYIILDKVHFECRVCFLESCNRRIRSTMGKTQLLKNNDAVLLSYSGGPSSTALLDLIKDSIATGKSRREQKLEPSILHIDTREDLIDPKVRIGRLTFLLNEVYSRYPDWPLYWTTIESASRSSPVIHRFDPSSFEGLKEDEIISDQLMMMNICVETRTKLCDSNSQDPERDHQERSMLIVERLCEIGKHLCTKELSFKFLFTGDNATTISNNVMKSVIFGQGDKMNTLAAVTCPGLHVNTRSTYTHCCLPIMRPLRDFTARELAFYLRLKAISQPVQFEPTLRYSRIADRVETYLASLDEIHSSTYSTLTSLATRMRPKDNCDRPTVSLKPQCKH